VGTGLPPGSAINRVSWGSADENAGREQRSVRGGECGLGWRTGEDASVAELAAGVLLKEGTTPAGEGSVEAPLECSLMFSRGGEPVSAVAVDEGFVQALIRFALDYAKTRSR